MNLSVGKTYYKVANKSFLAPIDQHVQLFYDVTEQKVDNLLLVLRSALFPKAVFFNNHVEVVAK